MDGVMLINGFQFAALNAGIRGKKELDLGLIYCEKPASAAAVFTKNIVAAAPVLLGRERFADGQIQAVLINSGIANACTGTEGMEKARLIAKMTADALAISEELVIVSSTGVIGQQLDISCFSGGITSLVSEKSAEGVSRVAEAIMTTDTVQKSAIRKVLLDGKEVTIAGIAKGAGMIMPNMATMLGFIMTDACVAPSLMQEMLQRSVDVSFNRITVDGDTSTNDTVMLLASGNVENCCLENVESENAAIFQNVLTDVCLDLAKQIVADGEGASKLVTVKVTGAKTEAEVEMMARTVANSPLVKTAFFGEDANWGRIIGAMGRAGVVFDPDKVDIFFDQVKMVQDGLGLGRDAEKEATCVLKKDTFTVRIDLKNGDCEGEIFTCDFSVDYVKINADYRT